MRSTIAAILVMLTLMGTRASLAATVPEELLIVPARSVGKISLGMSAKQVEQLLGKPDKEQFGAWMEYSGKNGTTDIFFDAQIVNEIRFDNKTLRTQDGLSLANCTQKRWHEDFQYARLQTKFMNVRLILKSGGLAIYRLDLDGAAGVPVKTVGLVFDDRPRHQARLYAGEKDGGWEEWDGQTATLWDEFKSPAAKAMRGLNVTGW